MDKYLKRLMKKVNPIAKMLTSTTFRQQTLANKKLYDRKKTKEMEQTHSEEMQDKLEPILCPMHEDYDDEKDNV